METIVGSPQQVDIWQELGDERQRHMRVEARAGTGKTFTITEGLREVDRELLGKTGVVAFGKAIANELEKKVPSGVKTCTMHSLGFAACRTHLGSVFNRKKFDLLLDAYMEEDFPNVKAYHVRASVWKLVSLAKCNLVSGQEALSELIPRYGVTLSGRLGRSAVLSIASEMLERCRDCTSMVDYSDMVWMPVVHGLKAEQFDTLMIDEAQDIDPCQRELLLECSDRFVLVGDTHQAIYAWRGADADSLNEFEEDMEGKVITFPLTVSRRCPKDVVELAKTLVPDFQAMEDAPDGAVIRTDERCWESKGKPAVDVMVLCRTNAPLVSRFFQFVRDGVPARIQGRDIGLEVINLVKTLGRAGSLSQLVLNLYRYESRVVDQLKKEGASGSALSAFMDKCDIIRVVAGECHGVGSVDDVTNYLKNMFKDNGEGQVVLSSIHRAKGLEADTVYLIRPELLPHPMAEMDWEMAQERNLEYVAYTRAKDTLVIVDSQ